MKIMLCNDDGIHAEGINVLHSLLVKQHEVFVIAPEEEKSGAGSSITTKKPLIPNQIKENFIAINGTPVDCVHLGLHQLCPFKPDVLLSGINFGANMAEDLLYSGTVGAAMEGREFSIPSIAISAAAFIQPSSQGKSQPNFLTAARIALDIVGRLPEITIDSQITLNVNVPNLNYEEINKINLTYPGTWGKRNPPNKETSNSGEDKFWITHRNKIPENEENSDIATLNRGEVSISPIGPRFLVNDYDQSLKEWINSFN